MPHEEEQPAKLNWQAVTRKHQSRVKQAAQSILNEPVLPSDFKTAVVKDFFELGYKDGVYNKSTRDDYIRNYIGVDRKLPLTFPKALEWLSEIMDRRKAHKQAENIRHLLSALEDVAHHDRKLKNPATLSYGDPKMHRYVGTVGDVLSMSEEIMTGVKQFYSHSPEIAIDVQEYCDAFHKLAKTIDRVRRNAEQGR